MRYLRFSCLRCFSRAVAGLLCALLLVTAANEAAASDDQAAGSYKVGMSREVITPDEMMWMSGYGARNRPAEGKLTDLWAKAMAVEDADGTRLVCVTLDLVGIDRETAGRIFAEASKRFGLQRKQLVLSTTHTHSGPVVGSNLQSMYFLDAAGWDQVQRYTESLERKVLDTIGKAIESLEPAELHWTVGRAQFAVNRRNNPEREVPELRQARRLRGPVDHDVPILVVKNADGELRGIVCGYACHATVLSGYEWSGDWPGFAQLALEERFPGVTAMVWAGCGADQNPIPRRDVELAKEYGAAIDTAVAAAIERNLVKIDGKLQAEFDEVRLGFEKLPTRDELLEQQQSENRFVVARAGQLLETLDREGSLAEDYPYPVLTWRLGDGPNWVFLGGEVVVDYALRIKWELEGSRTWVAGYCNDVMAYIPSVRVLKEGGYEGGGAMVYYGLPSPWDDSVEETITAEVRRQAERLGVSAAKQDLKRLRPYPDHSDLTVWLDDDGELQPIRSADDWQRRRDDILAAMQLVMGRLPGDDELAPLEVQEGEAEPFDGYRRLPVKYRVAEGHEVTAHLYLPAGDSDDEKRPAVLALHPTSPLGKRVTAGEGPRPGRAYAAELAERGYVVLAPDYPSFGELDDYDFRTDRYLSGTIAGIVNHRRGVDVLAGHPAVDPERIGVIGHSLGGHNAMFVAAMDQRIKAVVSSCGWDPFHDYKGGDLSGWSSDRYMSRIAELYSNDPEQMPFDFYEVAAALAPRAFFSNSPLGDTNFSAEGVMRAEPRVREVYRLLGAEENLNIEYPDSGHEFPDEVRSAAYEFLDRKLRRD